MLDHVDVCSTCREIAFDVTRATRPSRGILSRPSSLAAAAILLVGLGVALLGSWLPRETAAPSTFEALEAFAARLRAEDPAFAGFTPLGPDELVAPSVERGGFTIHEPMGRLDLPTRAAWSAVGGATSYDVTLFDGEGVAIRKQTTRETAAEVPLLPSGHYVVEVVAHGALEQTASRSFEVASADARARFRGALAHIAKRVDEPLAFLAQAHFALREGWILEAEALAARYAIVRPDDDHGRAVLLHVHGLTGRGE